MGATLMAACVMVFFAMQSYYASDAFRLDLSRPEHMSVREKIDRAPVDEGFSVEGDVDNSVLDDFLRRYRKESKKVTEVPLFSSDTLSDRQLGISD